MRLEAVTSAVLSTAHLLPFNVSQVELNFINLHLAVLEVQKFN